MFKANRRKSSTSRSMFANLKLELPEPFKSSLWKVITDPVTGQVEFVNVKPEKPVAEIIDSLQLDVEKENKPAVSNKRKRTRVVRNNLELLDRDAAPMPERLRGVIGDMDGVALIMEKMMTETDLNKGQCRLLMPTKKLRVAEFLRPEEKEEASRSRGGGISGLRVSVIEPGMARTEMRLKEWLLGSNRHLVLAGSNWNKIVKANRIKKGHVLQLWFYRDAQQNPSFALVNLGRD